MSNLFEDVHQPELYTRSTTLSSAASNNPTPNITSSEYVDARGRKIGMVQHGANEKITHFNYNAIGELLSVTDPIGQVTQYTYDLAGRQLSEDHPDRGLSTLTYDKASNVIEMTNPATDAQNDAIHLSYDYNRLRFKTMPAAGGAVDLYNVEYIYGHYGDGNNGAGRVVTIKQGGTFKVDDYKYDELGQMAQEVKTFEVPNVGARTFATSYRYDSFGRILKSIYPDGDQVTYGYYTSGELSSVNSYAGGISQSIISEIYYDGRGNISALHYGNGTHTTYDYADRTWTLMGSTVTGKTSGGTSNVSLMQRDYQYNSLGGISMLERNMDASLVQGGETQQAFEFTYDSFNRLVDGSMNMTNVTGTAYQVETAFNNAGGIIAKNSLANTGSQTLLTNASSLNYNLEYQYNAAKPHQLEAVVDQSSGNVQQFVYNESGSIKLIHDNTQDQEFYWNEEQWLNAVRNDKGIHHYVYDDKGERIMKSSVIQSNVYVNDQIVNTIQDLEPYTLYVNPYFVITEFSNADKVSKHYYMGTQRVASELAVQTTSYSPLVSHSGSSSSTSSSTESFKTQTNTGSTLNQGLESALPEESSNPWLNNLNEALSEFGEDQLTVEEAQNDLPTIESIYPDLSPTTSYKTTTARVIYWYHPDYIGNVDLVSDNSGEAYEFFLYNPWGESLYEWNSGTASFSSPYRFNGKELDQETGLAYYGARYYDNKISMWLSVDPLAKDYPSFSPYNFVMNNPISHTDPNGMWVEGAGFWNNLLFSDKRNEAMLLAGENGSFEKTDDGWRVNIKHQGSTGNSQDEFKGELLNEVEIIEIIDDGKRSIDDYAANIIRGVLNSAIIVGTAVAMPFVALAKNNTIDYDAGDSYTSANPYRLNEDVGIEQMDGNTKEVGKEVMKSTVGLILSFVPGVSGASTLDKVKKSGITTAVKKGVNKAIDELDD